MRNFFYRSKGLKDEVVVRGFTLIELMVVIALIMILSTVGVGTYTAATVKSKDTQRKSDLNQLVKALESFNNDVGRYPLSVEGENTVHCYVSDNGVVTNPLCSTGRLYTSIDGALTYYIDIPEDPEPNQVYTYISSGGSFELYAALENTNDRDLISDESGEPMLDPFGVACGNVQCNYRITESGLTKSI